MAEEFVSAFHDLQSDATNNEKLVEFVRSYYVNNLNASEFCSPLQLRLNPTNNDLPVNDPTFIFQNFFSDISRLLIKHLMLEKVLKSMNKGFSKQLNSIGVSKKVYSVIFNAAAMICAAAAAVVAANIIPMRGWARAGIGAVAAAASILFTALGKWRRSIFMKRENEVEKHKKIIGHMIMVARPIMTDLDSVYNTARSLEVEIVSLSEAVDDEVKVGDVGKRFEELLQNDENYNRVMKWAKDSVLQSIVNQLG
ncbi:hypothetical protein SASPL_139023 [Salvia splendens]|uniref:Uncharacterized protein n=1 Tax=Salvia splendens TaxID=180675 RepID=A0A8X8ZEY2_SALSN|nr:UPF0496 protein 1-like [Salvia splendens]KAG6402148.1 hypothetical protein SASPL_139023 [Salvia splendens]